MIPQREQRYLEEFVQLLRRSLGDKLLSVVLYGSAVREDAYVPGRSDLNLLVIAEPLGAVECAGLRRSIARTALRRNIKPLFFTPVFMQRSNDVFPVEWSEIQAHYQVLHGRDFIKDLVFQAEPLRLQLEREAKQNLLKFRQGLVFRKDIRLLVEESVKSTTVFLRHANEHLKGNLETPEHLAAIKIEQRHLTKQRLDEVVRQHLAFLERLAELVNDCHSRG